MHRSKLQDLCVEPTESILNCLIKLDNTAQGLLFVVSNGRLIGSLSDGDIRRALIKGSEKNNSIENIYNPNVQSLHYKASLIEIQRAITDKFKLIPLINDYGVIYDYASKSRMHQYSVMEPLLGGNELEYVSDCIKTNWISSQGKYVASFEEMLKKQVGVSNCLTTSNGTTALHLALITLGIGPGDEVIVPNLTFGASVNSIIHCGATPKLVDIEENSWNISVELLKRAITPKTKAIMPVHLYGNPCDMHNIMTIARDCNLFVIEDCAESLGATIKGKPVGSFGDAAAFSFFANKIITCGEGGALVFNSKEHDNKARILRDHGMSKSKKYWHEEIGYNYRLTNLQAAIGCAQLEQLSNFAKRRSQIFDLYDSILTPNKLINKQFIHEDCEGANWLYTICINSNNTFNRDRLIDNLQKKGIETRPLFYPMNEMPSFSSLIENKSFPISKKISYRGISLPSSTSLEDDEIRWIADNFLLELHSSLH